MLVWRVWSHSDLPIEKIKAWKAWFIRLHYMHPWKKLRSTIFDHVKEYSVTAVYSYRVQITFGMQMDTTNFPHLAFVFMVALMGK